MKTFNESANKAARSFIMPSEEFLKIVEKYTIDNKCNVKKVAEEFDVDVDAVLHRGKELKLW